MTTARGAADRPSRRAHALLLVLLVVLLLSAAAFLVAAQMQSRMASALDEGRNIHLRNLVDSGVALGLAKIREDRYGSGKFSQDLDGGSVDCTIEIVPGNQRELLVEAEYGGERWRYLFNIGVSPSGVPTVVNQRLMPAAKGQ